METLRKAVSRLCFLVLMSACVDMVAAETLESYVQKCDAAIGVTVPDFICDNGTLVPTTHLDSDGNCDRPNRLNGVCDPNSKFTVLTNSPSAYVVAHCRKQGKDPGFFGDIAVIQTNRITGATCFYQALGNLDGNVKAPSNGTDEWPWLAPARTAGIKCVRCHDNGPIVRGPYLAQLETGPNALPGATDSTFNKNQPYGFIGDDFASWKVYKVEIDGNLCISCHRLGVSNFSSGLDGTAIDFAIRATGPSGTEDYKNPHSNDSPIWMPPSQIHYDQNNANAARQIHDCAIRINENPLPNSASCRIIEYTGQECAFPDNVNWVVDKSCKITGTRTSRNVSVTDGAVLSIEENAVLMLDTRHFRIRVAPDSRITVAPGGRIQSTPE